MCVDIFSMQFYLIYRFTWLPLQSRYKTNPLKEFFYQSLYPQPSHSVTNPWQPVISSVSLLFCHYFKYFVYLTYRKRMHKQGEQEAEGEGQGEAGSPLSREPDAGLNPRTLGSWPEPKANAELIEPPRCPHFCHFNNVI